MGQKNIYGAEVKEEGVEVYRVDDKLHIDYRAREWCLLPYPMHPDGCPNYDGSAFCPPYAPKVENEFDLSKPHWFVVIEFDIGKFATKMKNAHPEWSDRNCRNCLRWQGGVKKRLKIACERLMQAKKGELIYDLRPEAMGVHVFVTARRLGIPIKKNPVEKVFKIALVGYPR